MVRGKGSPPTLKTELPMMAEVIVTLAMLALSIPDAVPLVPTVTLPNDIVDGVTVNVPSGGTPVPDSGTVTVALEALELIVSVALILPGNWGAKLTANAVLCEGPRVRGVEMPLMLNPVPLIPSLKILTLVPPTLVMVAESEAELLTATPPKLRPDESTLNNPSDTPAPERGNATDGSDALELIVTVPLLSPSDCGAKVTARMLLAEGPSVNGSVCPSTRNAVPATVTRET